MRDENECVTCCLFIVVKCFEVCCFQAKWLVHKSVHLIASQTWERLRQGEDALRKKLEPSVRPLTAKIGQIMLTIDNKLTIKYNVRVADKLDSNGDILVHNKAVNQVRLIS